MLEDLRVLEQIDIPTDLHDRVMRRLDVERERRTLRRRFTCALTAVLIAVVPVVPVWRALYKAFVQSGFWEYASLVFSDARIVFSLWQDFGLGMLESLPVMPIAMFLAVTLVLLVSIRFAVTYGAAWRTMTPRVMYQ